MKRRTGDTIEIPGDYQYKAVRTGNAVQRFWHGNKMQAISTLLPPLPGDVVLDVGCGSGVVSDFLAERGADVCAIDASPAAVEFAARTYPRANLRFHVGLVDEEYTSVARGSVDKIYCLEVIEHVYALQATEMLRLFLALLKPDGHVFLTTPNFHSLWPLIECAMDRCKLAPEFVREQHVVHFGIRNLKALCEDVGFLVDRVRTTCFLAPWLAPLSRWLADRVGRWELRTGQPFGSIIVLVLRKPGQAPSASTTP